MMLSIKELKQRGRPMPLSETYDLSQILTGREDVRAAGSLEADLTAEMREGLAVVTGTLRLPVEMPCSRCLKTIEETIAVPFMERFAARQEAVPKEDEEEVHVVSEDHIKLDSYIEEAVWLALPLAPVCSEDCEGLCPVCGKDRNAGPCGCSTDRVDPRLAGLADFFKQNDS